MSGAGSLATSLPVTTGRLCPDPHPLFVGGEGDGPRPGNCARAHSHVCMESNKTMKRKLENHITLDAEEECNTRRNKLQLIAAEPKPRLNVSFQKM